MNSELGGLTAGKAHALVTDIETPVLDDADEHHLQRVLRLRPGDDITVTDGAGRWRPCRFGSPIEPAGPVRSAPRPTPAITIGFALVKGERPELVVQKLTELGVDVLVPFVAERSVVHWDGDKAARSADRLGAIAREAVMQSRRVWLPVVEPLTTFDDLAGRGGAALADVDGAPASLEHPTLLVGPEGGWSARERASDLPRVRLGEHVLRAETAAFAAATVLCGLRSALFTSATARRG